MKNYKRARMTPPNHSKTMATLSGIKRRRAVVRRRLAKRRRRGPLFPRRGTRLALGELKFHDLDIDDAVIATGGNIAQDSCNIIAQGTTESTRIGRKCTIRSIHWRYDIFVPPTATLGNADDTIRVILYLDKQTNGAVATVTGILESNDYQSFNNLANKSRFRTLMDRTYNVFSHGAAGGDTTVSSMQMEVSEQLNLTVNIPIEYDNSATTGALTTQRTNNIGVLLLSRSGKGGFLSKMRLRFADS